MVQGWRAVWLVHARNDFREPQPGQDDAVRRELARRLKGRTLGGKGGTPRRCFTLDVKAQAGQEEGMSFGEDQVGRKQAVALGNEALLDCQGVFLPLIRRTGEGICGDRKK